MPDWIRATDQVPTPNLLVLVSYDTAGPVTPAYWRQDPGEPTGWWQDATDCGRELLRVTHWRRLPDGPDAEARRAVLILTPWSALAHLPATP